MSGARNTPGTDDLPPCDLVLRGGITSGVVYPGAVAELGRRFRFVCIGGASAGAIAAGVAAAAEYGRQRGGVKDAFERVDRLASEVAGNGRMRRLFQAGPDRSLRAAGALLWTALGLGWTWSAFAAIGAAAVAGSALTALGLGPAHPLLATLSGLLVLSIGLAIAAWWLITRALPSSGFGLCGGVHPDFNGDDVEQGPAMLREEGALMDWLHAIVQDLSGRRVGRMPATAVSAVLPLASRPLTMRDLWGGDEAGPRAIDLLLTTTNVSQQLGHHFPFLERPGGALYFDPVELRRVLPRDVVRWMVSAAGETRQDIRNAYPDLLRLPPPADLPVILGVRLSLALPGLVAAVPLYAEEVPAPGAGQAQAPRLRRCWFSDGGITSNFPIHVFDGPIPRRPTFCVNLRKATAEEAADKKRLVYMAKRNRSGMAPRFLSDTDGTLFGFVSAIVSTARNAHENEMMLTPGHRDRIVHVLTGEDEGGMNLQMERKVIECLSARGTLAAQMLHNRFHPNGTEANSSEMGWHNQRWIRLRSLLAAQERLLADFSDVWNHKDSHWGDYAALRMQWDPSEPANLSGPKGRRPVPSYPWSNGRTATHAGEVVDRLLELAALMRQQAGASGLPVQESSALDGYLGPNRRLRFGAPRPKGALRMRPASSDPRANMAYR